MAELDPTRLKILQAAGPLFAAHGYDGTSVRDITRAAEVNVAAVNYHFRSKEELYVEAVRLAGSSCEETTPQLSSDAESLPPEQRLRAFIGVFVTRMKRDDVPEWHRELIMRELAQPRCGATEVFVEAFVKPSFRALTAIVRDLVPADTSDEDVHLIGGSIVGQCLHQHHARNITTLLVGSREYRTYTIERLTEHIWRFSLAAIRGMVAGARTGDTAMNWIALKMLTGDRVKYLGIVFGVTFAALLMTQQASIFWGLMTNTSSQILDIEGADIWVMDPNVRFIDDIKPMSEDDLYRVRGVPGVAWAVRLYKGIARARFEDGNFQQMILIGLDDATLVGFPRTMLVGDERDLSKPDAVIMDAAGYKYLWPNDKDYEIGKTFEMNDRRAVIVGICKSRPTFQTFPIVYTRYTRAIGYMPRERKVLSFVLAQPSEELTAEEACARIEQHTRKGQDAEGKDKPGLKAVTRQQFIDITIDYYMKRTGIPINFGITVVLGFVVGAAIAGQTFYLFTVENLKQFGALKAMGVSNWRIVRMSLLQALVVGVLGYGLGVGGASLFGLAMTAGPSPAFRMTPFILVLTGAAVLVIVLLASLLSIRKVLVLEPAVVFK